MEPAPSIVPLAVPRPNESIRIEKNALPISLPSDISLEILLEMAWSIACIMSFLA